MYNSITERVIRSAPQIGNIDMERLPQELTRIFAEIVSLRLQSVSNIDTPDFKGRVNNLRALANNLETIALVAENIENKESVAFVSATAHYLLLKIEAVQSQLDEYHCDFSAEGISSGISAILLFLIGNSPADAAEVSNNLKLRNNGSEIERTLCSFINLLSVGGLKEISDSTVPVQSSQGNYFESALDILWQKVALGIQQMASRLLGKVIVEPHSYFQEVIDLSLFEVSDEILSTLAGPFHLARLLQVLESDLLDRGVINIPPPAGVDGIIWFEILSKLATERPYLWDNHFSAIKRGLLNPGVSSVLTFPTGAGKSTLSELKIASAYLSGRSVVYIVPTHALEDQVKSNLIRLFDESFLIDGIAIDSEFTEVDQGAARISVMTPERCLSLLAIHPSRFASVGLVVFDEFHLIHGSKQNPSARNIDAMFCLLSLLEYVSEADFFLISAMVENGQDVAKWIEELTQRSCVLFDSSWKPTRQIHSCLIFQEGEIEKLSAQLKSDRKQSTLKAPSKKTKESLLATPFAYFSLKNIWDSSSTRDYFGTQLLNKKVALGTNKAWELTSNRYQVSAELASYFAQLGMKTLVFVDNPTVTKSTADQIVKSLGENKQVVADFEVRNRATLRSLQAELGDLKYSYYANNGNVAMHHGKLLPMERRLNESLFKRKDGVSVVVATATLAQGINLPAEVVILAGDDRYDEHSGFRESMMPYEILNAAGRAGRAGLNAQGIVIVVPGDIITVKENSISSKWWELKNNVFSKNDQCLIIEDPLQHLLDSLQDLGSNIGTNERNFLLRFKPERFAQGEMKKLFGKSFAAFKASREGREASFEASVTRLIDRRNSLSADSGTQWVEQVSFKTGLDESFITRMGYAIREELLGKIELFTVSDFVKWLFNFLKRDPALIDSLFPKMSTRSYLKKALGSSSTSPLDLHAKIQALETLVLVYISGYNMEYIDNMLPGRSDQYLNNARTFVLRLIPDLSFAFGLIALICREIFIEEAKDPKELPNELKYLATCIREGFDIPEKLFLKLKLSQITRVECHQQFESQRE